MLHKVKSPPLVIAFVSVSLIISFCGNLKILDEKITSYAFYLFPFYTSLALVFLNKLTISKFIKIKNIQLLIVSTTFLSFVSIVHVLDEFEILSYRLVQLAFSVAGLLIGFSVSVSESLSYKDVKSISKIVSLSAAGLAVLTLFYSLGQNFKELYFAGRFDYQYSYQAVSSVILVLSMTSLWLSSTSLLYRVCNIFISFSFAIFSGIIGSSFSFLSFLLLSLSSIFFLIKSQLFEQKKVNFYKLFAVFLGVILIFSQALPLLENKLQDMRYGDFISQGFDNSNSISSISSRQEIRSCILKENDIFLNVFGSKALCEETSEHSYLGVFLEAGILLGFIYSLFLAYVAYSASRLCIKISKDKKEKIAMLFPILLLSMIFQRWPSFVFYFIIGLLVASFNRQSRIHQIS